MRPLPPLLVAAALSLLLAVPASAACGDGTLEAGEACDDGNTVPGDCCSANCAFPATNGAPCTDGLFCTTPDRCQGGVCAGGASPCNDDALSCTVTTCDEDADVCRHVADDMLCDDGVFCNGKEVCDTATGAGCRPAAAPVDCSASSTACRRGVCDEAARTCITEAGGDPAVCDPDGDGLSIEDDGCPQTPRGARVFTDGCAAIDLVRRPQVLLGPAVEAIVSATDLLRTDPELESLARKLDRLARKLDKARDAIGAGQVCTGTKRYAGVVRGVDGVQRRLSRKLGRMAATATSRVARALPDDDGDHRNTDAEVDRLDVLGQLFNDFVVHVQSRRPAVDALCAAVAGRLDRTGKVASVDDTGGFIELEDGITIAFSPGGYKSGTFSPADHRSDIAPGIQTKLKGVRFDDGTGATVAHAPTGTKTIPNVELSPFACLELVVLPFQRYLDVPVDQLTKLPRAGYENLAKTKYLFEEGMWLGAAATGTCGDGVGPTGSYVRRSLRLVVRQGVTTWVMALDLAPGEIVPFPIGIDPSTDAVLRVTARAQQCNVLTGCDPTFTAISGTAELAMRVAETGTYCTAIYETTEFALEDADFVIGEPTPFAQFQPAKVVDIADLLFSVDPGTTPTFHAEAYRVMGDGSSYPVPQPIGLGDEFAIFRDHDFYSKYDLFPYESTGVSATVGLQWPHAVGTRHGSPVRYACDTPVALVRDLVDTCSAAPNSYYRLPFYPGYPFWTMGQGNNGSFTHNGAQAFAFDLIADLGTTIRAARGGKVLKVKDDLPSGSNCYLPFTEPKCRDVNNFVDADAGCSANRVRILHEDGTVGHYIHIPMNGASVSEGTRVRRGDEVAIVGNTGCSSAPHLHFHVTGTAATSQTIPVRFQTLVDTCFVPSAGDLLLSNNAVD